MSSEQLKPVPGLKPESADDGNLGDISKAGSLHEFLMGLHKQFGPIASFWWGKMYTVSVASADLFQEIAHVFDRPLEPFAIFRPLMEPKCIQFANKDEGLKRREHYCKVLSEEAVKRNFPQLQQVADELADKWTKMGSESKIQLNQHTSLFALKAIVHTLFGNIMKDDSKEELDFRSEADAVWGEMEISLVKPRTKEREEHMREGQKDLVELIKHMIQDRQTSPPKVGEETLLDMILSYTDDEEVQHADALEFTTSGQYILEYVLTCAVYYVATHPDVEQKLHEEIEKVLGNKEIDGSNIKDLIYLRQVIDESLRCSVSGVWGARFQEIDIKLGGYDIPKNTPVINAQGVAMKDEKIWPNPDMFDPERFSSQNTKDRSKFWFSSWGVGRRQCIAMNWTYTAISVFLVTVFRKFKVYLVDKNQLLNPVYGLIPHQKDEILISLTPR